MNPLKCYKPYKQDDFEYGIFINRLAPGKNSVTVNFASEDQDFTIIVRKNKKIFQKVTTQEKSVTINHLPEQSELTVQIISKKNKSAIRKFHTGDFLHDVINYVDKEETQYAHSGNFLGSPFIIRFQGKLWVTMDIFKNGGTKDNGHTATMLFVSEDEGKSWQFVCDFVPSQWGRLFVVNNELYFYGSNLFDNSIDLIKSNDGFNWGESVTIVEEGRTSPTQILVDDKYIVFAFRGVVGDNESHVKVASGNIRSGLMHPASWRISNEIVPDFAWGGDQTMRYAEEGNIVEYNNQIYVFLRFAYQTALVLHYDLQSNELRFEKTIDMECGWCKFYIEKYQGYYYAMGNTTCFPRQVMKLYRSCDLEKWDEVKIIDDITHLDKDLNGVQYPSFFIEKDKLYLVLRIALNGAETFHNSNATVFDILNVKI
ncbi:MAG: hypothetical protein ACOX3K_02160 [Bacilli bacterium]